MSANLSAGKKALFTVIFGVLSVGIIFLAGELTVSSMGHTPWNPPTRITEVSPGGSFFKLDSHLGYKHPSGVFTLTLNQQHSFSATLDSSGNRSTSRRENEAQTSDSGNIWIFGGSFTFGWGVEDAEAFPSLVATKLPGATVQNFGVGGYGTLQSLYQFQQFLNSWQTPETVVLAYASFHDQRNTCNRYWLKAIAPHTVLKELSFPSARLQEDALRYEMNPVTYHSVMGSKWSALMNFWDNLKNKEEEEKLQSNAVTRRLIQEMVTICRERKIRFILAGIEGDEHTQNTLTYFKERGIETVDVSVDLSLPENNLLPADPHPSAQAHQLYAAKLLSQLIH